MRNVKDIIDVIQRIYAFLNTKLRIRSIMVMFIIIISSYLELLGISILIPFVTAMLNPAELLSNEYISKIMQLISLDGQTGMLTVLGIGIIILYVIKNGFLMFSIYCQTRFQWDIRQELSTTMLNSYLNRPYTFFIETNSSEMLRGLDNDILGVYETIYYIFSAISASMVILVLSIFIIRTDVFMAMSLLGIALLSVCIIFLVFKRIISQSGVERQKAISLRIKTATQAIFSIKEIMVMQRKRYFIHHYREACEKEKKTNIKALVIMKSPEKVIEVVFVIGIMFMVYFKMLQGMDVNSYIPELAAFAVAAIKMLPNIYTISQSMTQILYLKPSVDATYENVVEAKKLNLDRNADICDIQEVNFEEIKKNFVLKLRDVSWRYSNSKEYILDNLSLEINKGDVIAFVGKSGAGKTTLADVMLGLLPIERGKITINGIDVYSIPYVWSKLVGYVPQSVNLLDESIRSNVVFGLEDKEYDDALVWRALKEAHLDEFVGSLPNKLDTLIGERGVRFSGGQCQRLAIARALYYDPEIIIFDEATAALDVETEKAVMESINSLKGVKTMIIIAHRLETIKMCNQIYEVEGGKLVQREQDDFFAKNYNE